MLMKEKVKILHLEDDENYVYIVSRILKSKNIDLEITRVETEQDYKQAIRNSNYHLVLADFSLPSYDGFSALYELKKTKKDIPFIIFSGAIGEENAIKCLKTGATDYVFKQNIVELYPAIRKALDTQIEKRNIIQIHKQLEENYELLNKISSFVPDAIIMTNHEGKMTFVNRAAETMFGYFKDELIGESLQKLIVSKNNYQTIRKDFTNLKSSTTSNVIGQTLELTALKKDSIQLDIELTLSAVKIHNEWQAVVIMRDISERKKAENVIKYSKEIYQKAIENAQGVPYKYDFNTDTYTFMGEKAKDLLETAISKINGKKIRSMVKDIVLIGLHAGEDPKKHDEAFKAGKVDRFKADIKIETKDGKEKWLSDSSIPVKDEISGEITGSLGILQDITERKNLEYQLANNQKLESIGQLAAGIAHEINTPIQFVSDNVHFLNDSFKNISILLDKYRIFLNNGINTSGIKKEILDYENEIDIKYLTEDIPVVIAKTLDGVSRVLKIVKAMKDFSHPGSNKKIKTNINKALEDTITISKNEWKYVANIDCNFDKTIPMVNCFAGELNQVFLNIIANAAHSIKDKIGNEPKKKGIITISTQQTDAYVVIKFSDTGEGIPKKYLPKIFDPFFTTKTLGTGTGQGLAISHSVITQKHNGKLEVETEIGKGSTFIIKLPIHNN